MLHESTSLHFPPSELVPLPLIRDAGLPRGTHFFGQGCLTCCAPFIPYLLLWRSNLCLFHGSYSMLILLTERPLNCSVAGPSYRGSALAMLLALQETVMIKKTGEIALLLIITAWANTISMLLKHGNHYDTFYLLKHSCRKSHPFSSFASPYNTAVLSLPR